MKPHAIALALLMTIPAFASAALTAVKLGGGIHYLHSLEQIKDSEEFDENSLGYLGSLQLSSAGITVEGLAEYIPDYLGFDENLVMPQVYLLLGQLIYVGAGAGWGYYNKDWTDDPFYALRAGVNVGRDPLGLDVFATYRFMKWKVLENVDSEDWNSITFGAVLRVSL